MKSNYSLIKENCFFKNLSGITCKNKVNIAIAKVLIELSKDEDVYISRGFLDRLAQQSELEKLITSVEQMFKTADWEDKGSSISNSFDFLGLTLYSDEFDELRYPKDNRGNTKMIAYSKTTGDGKIYMMTITKLLTKIFADKDIYKQSKSHKVISNRLTELLSQKWEADNSLEGYEVTVDDDFERIYIDNEIDSCMTEGYHYKFYESSVNASAASLTSPNGDMVARCIIFNEVLEIGTKNTYRYAERQYATQAKFKQVLINRLYEGDYIDIHKDVNASCQDSTTIKKEDESFPLALKIEMALESGDYMAYQDTFKWYDQSNNVAYNHHHSNCEEMTSTDEEYRPEDRYTCDVCGASLSEDDALWAENGDCLCSDCGVTDDVNDVVIRRSYAVYSNEQRGYIHQDQAIEINGNYYHEDSDSIGYDEIDDEYILADDGVTLECGLFTHEDNATEIDGEWYSNTDDRIVQIDGDNYLSDSEEVVYDEIDECYILTEESVMLHSDECTHESNAVEVGHEWHLIGSDHIIEINGTYYHIESDELIEIDGVTYVKDSDEVMLNQETGEYELTNK